jgi:hypothetical protein
MAPETLTPRRLNRATLARQMLLAREPVGVVEGVEHLAGMQAQDPGPPFVGLWSRLEGFRADDLRTALGERAVVRATLMRATLHLASTADYRVLRAALEPVLAEALRVLGARGAGLEVDPVLAAARRLLAGAPRTFAELRALLAEEFPDVSDRALGYAVRTRLPLVMVVGEGRWGFPRVARFALADEWIEDAAPADGAAEGLVRRYLAAFGPATAADAQTWSGLRGLKAVVEGMRPELAVFRDERGREVFDLPDAPRPDEDTAAPARFLPEFDNLVLAHADRTRLVAEEHRPLLVTKNLRVRATFLWDGRVAGTWEVERRRGGATLTLTPFARLPKGARPALSEEGDALLAFLEEGAATRDVRFGAVSGSSR